MATANVRSAGMPGGGWRRPNFGVKRTRRLEDTMNKPESTGGEVRLNDRLGPDLCSVHGLPMMPYDTGTPEHRFCGTWVKCPVCYESILTPSEALKAQLAEQEKRAKRPVQPGLGLGV